MLACPFCGASETDRFELEGHRFLVFGCMFSPAVTSRGSDAEIAEELRRTYVGGEGGGYFRRTCDRLHLYVTQGAGGRTLRAAEGPPADPDGPVAGPLPVGPEGGDPPPPPRSRPASSGR